MVEDEARKAVSAHAEMKCQERIDTEKADPAAKDVIQSLLELSSYTMCLVPVGELNPMPRRRLFFDGHGIEQHADEPTAT